MKGRESLLGIIRWIKRVALWGAYTAGGFIRALLRGGRHRRLAINLESTSVWGKVAIVGRAESARLIVKSGKNFDVVILANYTDSDVTDPAFLEYLQSQRIVLLSNIGEPVFSPRILRRLHVVGVIWAGFLDGRDSARKRSTGRLNSVGQKVWGLPSDFPVELFHLTRGTGILGVALAALRSSEVDIFGIDFYKTDYIASSFAEGAGLDAESLRAASDQIRDSFVRVVHRFTQTHFVHWSGRDLGLKNLFVANYERYVKPL